MFALWLSVPEGRIMRKTLAAAIALFVGISGAVAQDMRGQPVADRPRSDYDPVGLRAGGFLVLPSIAVEATYDDNIYAQESRKDDDYIFIIAPKLLIRSDWNVHYMEFHAAAELGRHHDFTAEDYDDYQAGLEGRLDIAQGWSATATSDYRRAHDERGTPSDAGGREPTEYDMVYSALGLNRTETRITLRALGTMTYYNYDDTPGAGAAIIDQDFRDRTEYAGSVRLGYEFMPDVSTFIQGNLNWRDYDSGNRDSDGYRLDTGFAFDFGGITTGEIYAGYRSQNYDSPDFSSQSGFSYGGSLLWNPSGLTSVQLSLINDLNESTLAGASGYVSNGASLQIDHELQRNVLIGGRIGYTENDYRGLDRLEKMWTAGAKADYLLNRSLRLGVSYTLTDRSVNVTGQDYTRNQVMLSLRGSL